MTLDIVKQRDYICNVERKITQKQGACNNDRIPHGHSYGADAGPRTGIGSQLGVTMKKYLIIGHYKGNGEVVDHADDFDTAQKLADEYSLAFGPDWDIEVVQA